MLEGIQNLVELSRVDVELTKLEKEKAGLPAAREAFAQELEKGAEAIQVAEAALAEAEQEQRRHESAVADQETLIAKLEGQQPQVKTNEAYTALLHEIDAARAAISDAEDHVLEAMEGIETARETLERAKTVARGAEQRVAEQRAAIDERETSLDQSLANLRRERERIAAEVDPALVARYAKIASRRSPPVAEVKNFDTCNGCQVGLPPQLVIEMRKGEELITCGNCNRILVFSES